MCVSKMANDLTTPDFEQLLKEQYGLNSEQLLKRMDEQEREMTERLNKWSDYLVKCKAELVDRYDISPALLIKKMERVCELEMLTGSKTSLCETFANLRTNPNSIVNMLEHLNLVQNIPEGGLTNTQIDGILHILSSTFGGV